MSSVYVRLVPILVLLSAFAVDKAMGDVVVIANRTGDDISFTISAPSRQDQDFQVADGDLVSIPTRGRVGLRFAARNQPVHFQLDSNSAYYFRRGPDGQVQLHGIDLPGDGTKPDPRQPHPNQEVENTKSIAVKILVDEEEPGSRRSWEQRLQKRLETASAIFERYCRIRFQVVATGTWRSNNELTDLEDAMRQFEKEVDPGPAVLAIGFTGQPMELEKGMHIGGSRGPLRPHMLLMEWLPGLSEAERLELLVHELGHFLGAAHSPEPDSVMRPLLADRRARLHEFPIRPDVLNTLVICLVADEIRTRNATRLSELSSPTRQRLRQIYSVLAEAFPEDSAAGKIDEAVEISLIGPLAAATRQVVRSMVRAARDSDGSGAKLGAGPGARPRGDQLTDYYVRQAARAASQLPAETGRFAFLLGIGIALDDSDLLQEHPLTRQFCQTIESSSERAERLQVLGDPTMLGRRDLAQHFVVSAFLTAHAGSLVADAAGLAKEILDAQGGSGFSFPDLAANQAGIWFARHVLSQELTLADLAVSFSTVNYIPAVDGLPEGLSASSFQREFGGESGRRYHETKAEILARVQRLPPYRSKGSRTP